MLRINAGISCSLITLVAVVPSAMADMAATNSTDVAPPSQPWQKPAWLTDLSAGAHQGYDNNLLLVSGNGLAPEQSWITTISGRVGFDVAPLIGAQSPVKALTLVYAPDFNIYQNASQESYDAHRVLNFIRFAEGNFSFSLTNAFLYNDGSRTAPIYAESQLPGGNSNDKFRNFYAQAAPRERRDQIQDRSIVSFQYGWDNFFVRPTASLLYYDLNTILYNAAVAPFIGYQNWPDRYDVNGGVDGGYKVTPALAVTLGYRYGYQYQAQFPLSISADRHFSSSTYQRVLAGVEGNLWSWLSIKLAAGPDFRDYNPMAAVNNSHDIFPYVEATVTANITPYQTLTFATREWQWVASTGLVPYYDSNYLLTYHWSATPKFGLDLLGKILEADFTSGNDFAGTAPSLRNDIQYGIGIGATYSFTENLSANVVYNFNLGRNLLDNLPAKYAPSYRNFSESFASLGLQYAF